MTSENTMDSATALVRLDAIRWLHRVSYHIWRMAVHLPDLIGEPLPSDRQPVSDAA